MMRWIEKLKNRWDVSSTIRVFIILIVFSCTGITILFLKPFLFGFLFGGKKPSGWNSVLYYSMSPVIYNILLLFYGTLLGQFYFFWNFEKKLFRRIGSLFKKKKSP